MRRLPFEYAVRNLGRSPLRLSLSLAGSAAVVLLVVAAGSFVQGMTKSLAVSGDARRVILLGAGSEESLERSEISSSVASLVAASVPGIEHTLGVPHVSAEVHVQLPVRPEEPTESTARLCTVRGVTHHALVVYESVQIVEGRFPEPGAGEVMVGARSATKLAVDETAMAVGKIVWIDDDQLRIVGRFVAPGTVMESEVWMPLADLKTLTRRDTDSCVTLRLGMGEGGTPAAEFADIDAFAKQRLDLELVAMLETDYYASLSRFFGPIRFIAWATAGLIAMGGLFGGLNTMYAAFASRVRELGMLECLGYRRMAIVISLVQESTLMTISGALVACVIAMVALDGLAVRFSMGVFGLVVDERVIAIGLISGAALGVIGALPPALRALRLPIPEALRAH
jgi:putative ABC transport system permease protein